MLSLRIQTNTYTVRSFWKKSKSEKSHKKTKDLARYFERTLFIIIIIIKNDCYNNKKKKTNGFFYQCCCCCRWWWWLNVRQTNQTNCYTFKKEKEKCQEFFLLIFGSCYKKTTQQEIQE